MSDDAGWTDSEGSVSVAWLSDVGPREENQDGVLARVDQAGSWLIAVADGLGGQPRGADASKAAIDTLPRRITTSTDLYAAFGAANDEVAKLAPVHARFSRSEIRSCPATTLCAAAWTPEGGLLVGHSGDTLPVLLWRDDQAWTGRGLGRPHRSSGGFLVLCLGAPGVWPKMTGTDRDRMDLLTEEDIEPPDAYAIAILSDGAWEAILSAMFAQTTWPPDPLGAALAACVTSDALDANSIAHQIMDTARTAGLDDNATAAVAHIGSSADSASAVH